MVKVVMDTNIIVSATIAKHGNEAKALDAWRDKKVELIISPQILEEMGRVLLYRCIRKQMFRKGGMTVDGVTYLQYTCPLYWSKKIRQRYLLCPANHPKFFSQKGCNYLIRLTPSIREEIDCGSQEFKSLYNKRTSIERCFSRLLSIAMQHPTTVGLNATRNHSTIAHITSLLVALTAYRNGQKDKIRFIKSFVPNFLDNFRKLS